MRSLDGFVMLCIAYLSTSSLKRFVGSAIFPIAVCTHRIPITSLIYF
jgi:hypothetical protein